MFQLIALTVVVLCLLLSILISAFSREPCSFLKEKIFSEHSPDQTVLSFLLTFLFFIFCTLPFLLILRFFSDMPPFKEGIKKDPFFQPSAVNYSGEYGIPSPWLRIWAFFIDRMLSILIILAGIPPVVISETCESKLIKLLSLVFFFILLSAAIFYSYSRDAFKGKSLGRKLLKMRVVDTETGKPIKFWKSFIRELSLHLAPLIVIEILFIWTKPDRRRIGDLWTNSIVVKDSSVRQSESRLSP